MRNERLVVYDIGARGGTPPRFRPLAPILDIVAVDADDAIDFLTDIPASHYWPIPAALSDQSAMAMLYITRKPDCSSLFPPHIPFLKRFPDVERFDVTSMRQVQTTTLIEIAAHTRTTPDFIKLDTQGSELAILKGAGRLLDHVVGIDIEVEFAPIYLGAPLFTDVDEFLRRAGFELWDLNRHYWRALEDQRLRCVFADALYFRPPTSDKRPIIDAFAACYRLTLRQTLAHGYQCLWRWAFRCRPYDSDQQLGRDCIRKL